MESIVEWGAAISGWHFMVAPDCHRWVPLWALLHNSGSRYLFKYEMDWYTQDLPNGQTTLYAVAYDSSGEYVQDVFDVNINNLTRADSIPPGQKIHLSSLRMVRNYGSLGLPQARESTDD